MRIKKQLLALAMLMVGMAWVGCSNNGDDIYDETALSEAEYAKKLAAYEEAFVSLFGQPAANQSWDFTTGATFTVTRGINDSNALTEWPSNSDRTYGFYNAYVTGNGDPLHEADINKIYNNDMDAIEAAIDDAVKNKDFTKMPTTGIYLFRTFATVRNAGGKKDKYYNIGANFGIKDKKGNTKVTNNWIAQQGVKKDGSKRGTTGSQHTCCIDFDKVPEDAVWFANSTEKKQNVSFKAKDCLLDTLVEVTVKGNTYWCFKCEEQGKYSDFILIVGKIVNSSRPTPVPYRIKRYFVEDLGGAGAGDIDFNDVVFDVEQFEDGTQRCIVRALGGTLPIKIKVGESDWWSKPNPSQMLNTGVDGEINPYREIAKFDVTGWDPDDNNVQVQVEGKSNPAYQFTATFPEDGTIPLMVVFSGIKVWNEERVPVSVAWFNGAED